MSAIFKHFESHPPTHRLLAGFVGFKPPSAEMSPEAFMTNLMSNAPPGFLVQGSTPKPSVMKQVEEMKEEFKARGTTRVLTPAETFATGLFGDPELAAKEKKKSVMQQVEEFKAEMASRRKDNG